MVGWSFPVSAAAQKKWFERSLDNPTTKRLMVDTDDGETIGLTGLWDIDWRNRHALSALKLGPKAARGRGYGTDAILTLMAYAFFEVGLNRLWSSILPYNAASYRAYVEKCGWRVEGVLRQDVYRHGRFHDLYRIGVLREDFEAHPRFEEYAPRPPEGDLPAFAVGHGPAEKE